MTIQEFFNQFAMIVLWGMLNGNVTIGFEVGIGNLF